MTHVMLIDAAMVYPTAIPKRFKYWINPHALNLAPPEKDQNAYHIKTQKDPFHM